MLVVEGFGAKGLGCIEILGCPGSLRFVIFWRSALDPNGSLPLGCGNALESKSFLIICKAITSECAHANYLFLLAAPDRMPSDNRMTRCFVNHGIKIPS